MRKVILSLLFLFAAGISNAMDYNDIIRDIRVRIRDTGPTSEEYRYSDLDLIRMINYVEEDIVSYTAAIEEEYYINTSSDTREYTFPEEQSLYPRRVSYAKTGSTTSYERLDYVTIGNLDNQLSRWEDRGMGVPTEYYIKGNTIGLDRPPRPAGVNHLKVQVVARPIEVSTSTLSNTPYRGYTNLYPFHKVISLGVVAEITGNYQVYYQLLESMRQRLMSRPDAFIGGSYID